MLSYQHGFHAGNRADVLKHAALDAILRGLLDQHRRFLFVDTHAGRGRYDLTGPQAMKTGEAQTGVQALLEPTAAIGNLAPWLSLVNAAGDKAYPGSPALARARLTEKGRLVLFEKHPAEAAALAAVFDGDPAVQVKREDGYAGALRLAPRRGEHLVVFSDPSYETLKDMEALSDWTPRALARWPSATIIVWLPLFKDGREEAFGAFLSQLERGIVAGARWPETSDKDTALCGSALIAYRVPASIAKEAAEIAAELEAYWNSD
ncbi:MAG: 23S rRNA (adenine(2030)-N(6))-methyltransferase RlmJ [Pseudomonadota bacterium]